MCPHFCQNCPHIELYVSALLPELPAIPAGFPEKEPDSLKKVPKDTHS